MSATNKTGGEAGKIVTHWGYSKGDGERRNSHQSHFENRLVEGMKMMAVEPELQRLGFAAVSAHVVGSCRIAIWKAPTAQSDADWSFIDAIQAKPLVREGADVLDFLHFRSVVQVCAQSGAVRLFAFASLSPEDPRVCCLDSGRKLLVGSYQTLYGIDAETGGVDFQVVLPEGGEVSQLEIAKRVIDEVALVVSETTVRCVSGVGAVLWVAHFNDRVKLTETTTEAAGCESLEPGASGVPWTCALDLYTGAVLARQNAGQA